MKGRSLIRQALPYRREGSKHINLGWMIWLLSLDIRQWYENSADGCGTCFTAVLMLEVQFLSVLLVLSGRFGKKLEW